MCEEVIMKKKKQRCGHCNSSFGYVRFTKNEFVCRQCGEITKLKGDRK
jgi:predicted RNA-binding Zn-ribbon protein involved in translation (DUF1610 family)